MNNVLTYKGYTGSVDFSAEDKIFHGRVLGIRDVITFEGSSVKDLEADFFQAVDDYLSDCQEAGKTPEKPFSGKFVLRLPPELHCKLSIMARHDKKSLNTWLVESLERMTSAQP